jgi:hypothetical protein
MLSATVLHTYNTSVKIVKTAFYAIKEKGKRAVPINLVYTRIPVSGATTWRRDFTVLFQLLLANFLFCWDSLQEGHNGPKLLTCL